MCFLCLPHLHPHSSTHMSSTLGVQYQCINVSFQVRQGAGIFYQCVVIHPADNSAWDQRIADKKHWFPVDIQIGHSKKKSGVYHNKTVFPIEKC